MTRMTIWICVSSGFEMCYYIRHVGFYGDTNRIIFKEERHDLEDAARRCSYEGIEKVIHSISRARSRIAANVNFDLTMELMFLDIKAVF